jgi:hypothetical protein
LKTFIAALAFLSFLMTFSIRSKAQSVINDTIKKTNTVPSQQEQNAESERIRRFTQDQPVKNQTNRIDSIKKPVPVVTHKPSPKKASIYAALFPGLGQIYNQKYWKLPIVYGGYVGLIYIFGWNNNNYNDYAQAYRTIAPYESTETMPAADKQFLIDFIKNPSINLDNPSHFSYAKTSLKGGKDFFRRNRDLTIIAIAALHVLSIIDASVDANLFDFDISNDLTLKVQPAPIRMGSGNMTMGMNLAVNF